MADYAKLPDAEINRLVAERMGWEQVNTRDQLQKSDPAVTVFWVERGRLKVSYPQLKDGWGYEVVDFLRDWQAFGRLWEHIIKDGGRVSFIPAHNGESCIVQYTKKRFGDITGTTPLVALALAFLAATEGA